MATGRVEVRQISLRGREQVFHSEGPGATLGEAPLFDGGGYIASAVAVESTRVLFVPRSRLIALCRQQPAVALAILKTMRTITAAALVLRACKLAFSTTILIAGQFRLGLARRAADLDLRDARLRKPSPALCAAGARSSLTIETQRGWVVASSVVDVAMVSALPMPEVLMELLPWAPVVSGFGAAMALAFILDQVNLSIVSAFRIA